MLKNLKYQDKYTNLGGLDLLSFMFVAALKKNPKWCEDK